MFERLISNLEIMGQDCVKTKKKCGHGLDPHIDNGSDLLE